LHAKKSDKKKAGSGDCLPKKRMKVGLNVGLGLAEALHAVARLPLIALPKQVDALKALQDVAFDDEAGGALKAFVL
jgi:hypothetical protein